MHAVPPIGCEVNLLILLFLSGLALYVRLFDWAAQIEDEVERFAVFFETDEAGIRSSHSEAVRDCRRARHVNIEVSVASR